jgi:hypothetical protein
MIYLFQHLPKCGGISFANVCEPWFAVPRIGDYAGSYPSKERIAEFAKARLDLDQLPPDTLVHGHLVHDLTRPQKRYGDYLEQKKCRLLSIVRDPLDRAISAYYHRVRVGKPLDLNLAGYIGQFHNPMARQLGCDKLSATERTAWLERYYFISVCDEMQLSLDVLAAKLGKPRVEEKRLNQSPREGYDLTPDQIARFGAKNVIDYAIFDYAVARLHREAATQGIAPAQ